MLTLPPVPPQVGWRFSTRLPRDYYVRLDGNDYSIHPSVIGRRVEVHADLTRVWAGCDGRLVADHQRLWAKHQTVTDFEHLVAAKAIRRGRADLVNPPRDRRSGAGPGPLRHPRHSRWRRRRPRHWRRWQPRLPGRGGLMTGTRAVKPARDVTGGDRVPDPGVEGTDTARERVGWRALGRSPGPTRSTWPPACKEVSAREGHGGEGRVRAARFPARKSLEDFDFEHARGLKRDTIAHLGTRLRHRPRERRLPRTARHRQDPPGHRPGHPRLPRRAPGPVRHRLRMGRPARHRPPRRTAAGRATPAGPLPAAGRRRGRLHPLRTRSQNLFFQLVSSGTNAPPSSSPPTRASAGGARSSATTWSPPR